MMLLVNPLADLVRPRRDHFAGVNGAMVVSSSAATEYLELCFRRGRAEAALLLASVC